MTLKIVASQCTSCSACEAECPNVAIYEKGGTFIINPKKCTECIGHFDSPQCAAVCPVDDTCVIERLIRATNPGLRNTTMSFEITPAAERFIRLMIRADGAQGSGFRLSVTPGGCSGLSADISVKSQPGPGESVIERNGVKLFLNAETRILLEGVTIDFADTASQTGLVFHDPKQKACGSHGVSTLQ